MTWSGSAIQGATTRPVQTRTCQRALAGLLAGEQDLIANAANFAALVLPLLPDLNWVAAIFLRGEELVLGPFRAARLRAYHHGRGVCGTAAQQRASVVLPMCAIFQTYRL